MKNARNFAISGRERLGIASRDLGSFLFLVFAPSAWSRATVQFAQRNEVHLHEEASGDAEHPAGRERLRQQARCRLLADEHRRPARGGLGELPRLANVSKSSQSFLIFFNEDLLNLGRPPGDLGAARDLVGGRRVRGP